MPAPSVARNPATSNHQGFGCPGAACESMRVRSGATANHGEPELLAVRVTPRYRTVARPTALSAVAFTAISTGFYHFLPIWRRRSLLRHGASTCCRTIADAHHLLLLLRRKRAPAAQRLLKSIRSKQQLRYQAFSRRVRRQA